MTSEEIKQKIDANNLMIKTLSNHSFFVLNTKVLSLLKENVELQNQCKHEFVNGKCIYCYKEENVDKSV